MKKLNYVFISGSFKPPHRGHLDMVKHYARLADHVIVFITDPKIAKRPTKLGTFIHADDSKKIFDIYLKAAGLSNVNTIISPSGNSFQDIIDWVEKHRTSTPYTLTIGTSSKGGDDRAREYINQRMPEYLFDYPWAQYVDFNDFIFTPRENISATLLRTNIDNPDVLREYMPDEISESDFKDILKILMVNTLNEDITSHQIHTEDLLLHGKEKAISMVTSLESLFDLFKGNTNNIKVSVKIDGSPSTFVASDFNGEAFVSSKSITGKTRKIARTEEECDQLFSAGLASKLKVILRYAKQLGIPKNEIWRGDMLFTREDLKIEDLDGQQCVTFHPNTIVYAVPVSDPVGKEIMSSEVGIAWHTRYVGKDLDSLTESFDVDVSKLNNLKNVFSIDCNIPSLAGRITFSSQETEKISGDLEKITSLVSKIISNRSYNNMVEYNEFIDTLSNFKSTMILEGQETDFSIEEFIDFAIERYDRLKSSKQIQKLKTDTAIERNIKRIDTRLDILLGFINENEQLIRDVFEVQSLIIALKNLFISKLNSYNKFKSYIQTDAGHISTSGEGFVVSDIDGNVQKLVSRLDFSRANFNPDVIKGWQSERRLNQFN